MSSKARIASGETVSWVSQSQSNRTTKTGVVFEFIPRGESMRQVPLNLWTSSRVGGQTSARDRYAVIVSGPRARVLYGPLASLIEEQNPTAKRAQP